MSLPHPKHRFARRATAAIVASIGVAAVSACDAPSPTAPAPDSPQRQVTVVGEGRVFGSPDTVTASVGVEVSAADVTAAMNEAGDRARAVIDALVTAGVERADISTTDIGLAPVYATTDASVVGPVTSDGLAGSQIVAYRATNAIDVQVRDVRDAPQVLALIVSNGGDATRIDGVRYSITDDSQLVRDARARAYADARSRAEQYAELSGSSLGPIVSISESTAPAPLAERGPVAAAAPVMLEPGTATVNFAVTAVWQLR